MTLSNQNSNPSLYTMRKNTIVMLLLAFVFTSCKTESTKKLLTLNATLTNIPDSTLFFLKDKTSITLDSAYVNNGKLILSTQLNSQDPESLMLLATSPEFIYTLLLLGNENVTFKADKSDFPWNINVSGSQYQDEAEKFNLIEFQRQQLKAKLQKKYGSDKKLAAKKIQQVSDSLDHETVRLIKENFNTYAALNRFKYHKTKFSSQELTKLYTQLDQRLQATVLGQAIKLQSEFPFPKAGDTYYDYRAMNQHGDTVSLSDIKNKYILLHFSSLACYGSQLSLPELKKLYQDHATHLEIVSISTDPNKKLWKNHVKRDAIPWVYLWDGKGNYNDAYIKYWETGTPNYVLISPDKIILERWFGFSKGIFQEKIEKHLNK